MDSSRRAVESYWRSRLIDSATSNEDKVTPVYKLEEICELLRSSHVSIVKEISEFILKRLEHKSPIVKQKALRLIKYAVGKSGVEFRREMQRHSVAVRQLFHYKGEPDALKGDALNKAVRDTAHEAITAIFSEEDNKPSPPEANNRRIQGFGNTSFETTSEDKKSFLSEVVEIGSASIKLGLSSLTQGHSLMKNETGSYKSPNLRRSLSIETEHGDTYQPVKYHNGSQSTFRSNNQSSGPWTQDSKIIKMEVSNGDSNASHLESKTRETRLLETIVTSGGVRLQPTRDAIQVFLKEAVKMDPLALSHALELKLQSPMWQVRMKAVCVLESILRKKDDDHFSPMTSYFTENKDVVVRCSESAQASLREKANKVLGLLGVDQPDSSATNSEKPQKAESANVAGMPDLIDTGDPNDCYGKDDSTKGSNDYNVANFTSPTPLIDDIFGDFGGSVRESEPKNEEDPFADVSFHTNESKEHADDLFSGMVVSDKQVDNVLGNRSKPETFDILSSNSDQENHKEFVSGLMADLSIEENTSSTKQQLNSATSLNNHGSLHHPDNTLGGILASQATGYNVNPMIPSGHMPYGIQTGLMTNHMNQLYSTQSHNYGAIGNLLAQQQFLATMVNFQHVNNVNMQGASVAQIGGAEGTKPLPDIFQSNFASQAPSSVINNSKKEENKAFDFISDHIAAARDPKRVI
ncbi:protein MODIFIED TRANSPORT TO THE VACUOLE 1 [Neltuma alba]|uniref:protein MODIFIED TRANSPORT TO THE VACUOLE 1 n=1 Tax=Neltuma alba TaxID=207710 RepID=UPI0010A53811|nr:protein MODIFIED TRANSPORT TO THE VACUOLE 1-like [Prosopis alba]